MVAAVEAKTLIDWVSNTAQVAAKTFPPIVCSGSTKLLIVVSSSDTNAAGTVTGTLKLLRNGKQIGNDIAISLAAVAGKSVYQLIESSASINEIILADQIQLNSLAVSAGAENSLVKVDVVFYPLTGE
jgi:hypothetical protein